MRKYVLILWHGMVKDIYLRMNPMTDFNEVQQKGISLI